MPRNTESEVFGALLSLPHFLNATPTQAWLLVARQSAVTELRRVLRDAPSVVAAAEALGVSHRTICRWRATYPELRDY